MSSDTTASRFSRAAAARGRGGRADEPEMPDREEPIHKAHGGTCHACGGRVDGHGKAMSEGGEVEKEYSDDDVLREEYSDGYDDKGRGYSRIEAPGALRDAHRRFASAAKERR